MRRHRCLLAGLALFGGFLAAYFAVATTVGFGPATAAWTLYGEPPVGPPVQEPICFWTDLGFVVSGLLLLRRLDRAPADPAAWATPLHGPTPTAVALGLIVVWMGPGSMLEHGTLSPAWGWFDATSIHWFGLFVAGYLLRRAFAPDAALAFWGGLAAAAAVIGAATWLAPATRLPISVGLVALLGTTCLLALVVGRRVGLVFGPDGWPAFGRAAAGFVVAMALLGAGAVGGPAAPWGHGAWHLAAGLSTWLVVGFLRAERPRVVGAGS